MADVNANIRIDVDTSAALAQIKQLQRQISLFHSEMAKGGAAALAASSRMQSSLVNSINQTGKFSAGISKIQTTTESFTNSLEKNKLSMGQYFRYAGASTKTFGKLFKGEFETINKVARERVKDLQTQYIKLGRDASGSMQAIKVRPLTLDMQNLGTQTAMAAQKVQLFNQLVKQGSTNLLNWGKNTQWAGRQLMVGFTVPLTIMGTVAAREFMKLEKQAIRFRRVYGEMFTSSGETEKAIAQVRELADEFTKYGVQVEKTMELAADAAQMGLMGSALMAQVTEATRLAVLGEVEQQQALETTISVTNAFGVATEDLAKKIDFLNAVENQTMVSIEDLTEAIPKAGPVVKQLGGDVEDLAFFLAAMREGGINASEGANALKSGLASMINPTRQSSEFLAQFGINLKGIVEANAGDVKGTVISFAQALDTLDPLNRARAIEQLFGKFQFSRISTLFQNVISEGSQASRVLGLTKATAEELAVLSERELKRVEDSPVFKFEKAIENIKTALAPVGEAFLKAVIPIIEFGTQILEKFNGLSDGAKNFIVVLGAIGGVVAPALLMVVGLVANGIANLAKFGQMIGQYFTSAGGSSKILGEQTSYLTQEQLEQLSVASSLEQVHARLAQAFTSEASAIQQLIAKYQQASIAMGQFNAAAGGAAAGGAAAAAGAAAGAKTTRYNPFMPPKYAKGTLSVPGTGNKDTQLSLLTPGEAVIPAKQSKKYAALIQGIIADNIPGFNRGRTGYSIPGRDLAHMDSGRQTTASALTSVAGSIGDIARMFANAGFGERNVNVKSRWGVAQDPEINRQTATTGASIGSVISDRKSGSARDFYEGVAGAGVAPEGISDDIDAYNEEFNRVFEEAEKSGTKFVMDTRANLEKRKAQAKRNSEEWNDADWTTMEDVDEETSRRRSGTPTVEARAKSKKRVREARYTTMTEAEESAIGQYGTPQDVDTRRKYFYRSDKKTRRGSTRRAGRTFETDIQERDPAQTATTDAKEALSASKAVLDQPQNDPFMQMYDENARNSPHNLAGPSGKQDGSEYKANFDAAVSGKSGSKSPLLPPLPPAANVAKPVGGFKGAMMDLRDKALTPLAKPLARAAGNNLVNRQGNMVYDVSKDPKSDVYKEEQLRAAKAQQEAAELQKKAAKEQMNSANIQEKAAQEQINTANLGEAAARQDMQNNSVPATAPRSDKRGMIAGGLFTAGSVAMGASMMGGPVGEVAGKVAGPLMAIGGIMPMLGKMPVQIQAVIVALGLLAYGVISLIKHFGKVRDESVKLAQAMGIGTSAIEKFAIFSGSVTSREIMDKRREAEKTPFAVQPGKKSFGESFFESEDGSAFAETINQSLAKVGRDKTLNDVYLQLGTSVANGALSALEAQSIAQALYGEVEDGGFALEVNSKLLTLLGPNGQNLLTDPLQVNLDLAATQQESLQNLIDQEPPSWWETIEQANKDSQAIVDTWGTFGSIFKAEYWGAKWEQFSAAVGLTAAEANIENISQQLVGFQNALENTQSMLDNIDLSFEQKIADARNIGDMDLVQRLQQDRQAARQEILDTQKEIAADFVQQYKTNPGEFAKGIKSSLAANFEGEELKAAERLVGSIKELQVSGEAKALLQVGISTGQYTISDITQIMEDFENRPDLMEKVINIGINQSGADASEVQQIINLINDPTLKEGVINLFDTDNMDEFNKNLKAYRLAKNVGSLVPFEEPDFLINLMYQDPDAAARIQADLNALEEQAANGPLTEEFVINMIGAEQFAAIKYLWDDMSESDRITATAQLSALINVGYADAKSEELANMVGFSFGGGQKVTDTETANAAVVERGLASGGSKSFVPGVDEDGGSSSGGGAEPQIDNLIKKLRDLRIATIDMKKGWEGMQQVLEKVFAGGSKGIDVFNGLSNQIRRMGVGESLIEMIVGMDPDEYEKRKSELFVFDKAGNIVGTTAKLKNMNSAFNAIAIGEYVNTQQQFIENTNHQFTAMNMLTAQGLSFVEAYEMVQDQAIATAIAMGATRAEIEQLINITRQMAGVREQYNKISAEEQAAKSVRETNKDFAERVAILKKLSKSSGQYSDEQINAILNDSNVGKLFLKPNIDANALAKALKNAEQQKNLELQVAITTKEGKKELFDNLTSEISEQFARQENKINIDFALATEGNQDIVRDAQNQIAAIQFAIDDYEAQLKGISDQEELINEKYDDRFEALDKVAAANQRVAASQKAQLNIADALSRGDIAAAAAAQQELRAQQAKDASESRKEQMEKQKEAELANVRSASGLSREQLEGNIKGLRDQIFGIEETKLEPAQEAIRIAEYNRDVQIDALEVSGKTRDQWEQIASQVDIATTNTEEFNLSVARALALMENLVNGTELDPMLFGGEVIDATPAPENGGGGGDDRGPAPTPPPGLEPDRGSSGIKVGGLTSAQISTISQDKRGLPSKQFNPVNQGARPTTQPAPIRITTPYKPPSPPPPPKFSPAKTNYSRYTKADGGLISRMAMGGSVKGYPMGGLIPYKSEGGFFKSLGSDTVPAMLTPGEFVIRRPIVQKIGKDNLERINNGMPPRMTKDIKFGMEKDQKFNKQPYNLPTIGPGLTKPGFDKGLKPFMPRIINDMSYALPNNKMKAQPLTKEKMRDSMYNYNLVVNVKSEANPEKIAQTVMQQIKRVDSQRVRGNRF